MDISHVLSKANNGVISVVVRATESESQESERFRFLLYDLVKTRLSEA